jgi:fused signal recognition particle receptor
MFGFFKKKEKEDQKNSKGLIARLREGLTKTRSGFTGRLDQLLFGKKEISEDLLEDLEEVLFTSDLGVATTRELIRLVQEGVARKELDQPEKLRAALKEHIRCFLNVPDVADRKPNAGEPHVIMMIGVNGVGKTTTIGKLGHQLKSQGNSVMFVAADTFRAAATEQLEIWAQRVGAELVKQRHGADPSAVVFDALSSALSKQTDIV